VSRTSSWPLSAQGASITQSRMPAERRAEAIACSNGSVGDHFTADLGKPAAAAFLEEKKSLLIDADEVARNVHALEVLAQEGRYRQEHCGRIDAANHGEFVCIVVERNLRLREQEAAEAGTSKEGFHRRQQCKQIVNLHN
jgi:hypothetical protein